MLIFSFFSFLCHKHTQRLAVLQLLTDFIYLFSRWIPWISFPLVEAIPTLILLNLKLFSHLNTIESFDRVVCLDSYQSVSLSIVVIKLTAILIHKLVEKGELKNDTLGGKESRTQQTWAPPFNVWLVRTSKANWANVEFSALSRATSSMRCSCVER